MGQECTVKYTHEHASLPSKTAFSTYLLLLNLTQDK